MYINWKFFCLQYAKQRECGRKFLRALAGLDDDPDLGVKVVARFPEYFCAEKQKGPVPLSLLCRLNHPEEPPFCDRLWRLCAKYGIPILCFASDETAVEEGKWPPLPEAFRGQLNLPDTPRIGGVISSDDLSLVMVECHQMENDRVFMSFIPAECVALDL